MFQQSVPTHPEQHEVSSSWGAEHHDEADTTWRRGHPQNCSTSVGMLYQRISSWGSSVVGLPKGGYLAFERKDLLTADTLHNVHHAEPWPVQPCPGNVCLQLRGPFIWENLSFTEVEVKEPLHVMIQITLYQLKSIDRDPVTLGDVTYWIIDDPPEQCVHCVWPISYGIHNLPEFHSIPCIASNQDAYVRIQHRNLNVRQIGPARDVLLGRNLVLCHRQWWLGIHSGQRNISSFTIPTHFKTRHCNARCGYITTMKCCDVDVGPLSTSNQLSHQLLRDYSVTAACVQESICGYLIVIVAKLDLHKNDRHGITGAFQVTTDSGNSDSCGRRRRHRRHWSQRRRGRRPWNDRVSVQGGGIRSLAHITDSFLATFRPPMTRAQTVEAQTVLHQKRHLVLMKDFFNFLHAWSVCWPSQWRQGGAKALEEASEAGITVVAETVKAFLDEVFLAWELDLGLNLFDPTSDCLADLPNIGFSAILLSCSMNSTTRDNDKDVCSSCRMRSAMRDHLSWR